MRDLTQQELECIDLLVKAWNAYVSLPPINSFDRTEFMESIHAAQRNIMARPAVEWINGPEEEPGNRRQEAPNAQPTP